METRIEEYVILSEESGEVAVFPQKCVLSEKALDQRPNSALRLESPFSPLKAIQVFLEVADSPLIHLVGEDSGKVRTRIQSEEIQEREDVDELLSVLHHQKFLVIEQGSFLRVGDWWQGAPVLRFPNLSD